MPKPRCISMEEFKEAFNDSVEGFCIECGERVHGVEPDASKYECPECETNTVYGPENIVILFPQCIGE